MLLPSIAKSELSMVRAKHTIALFNTNQLQHLLDEIDAEKYWFDKQVSIAPSQPEMNFYSEVAAEVKSLLDSGNVKNEVNENGLIIRRSTCIGTCFDFSKSLGKNWETFIEINDHYCYFISHKDLQIVSYCESDVVLLEAESIEQFKSEVADIYSQFKLTKVA